MHIRPLVFIESHQLRRKHPLPPPRAHASNPTQMAQVGQLVRILRGRILFGGQYNFRAIIYGAVVVFVFEGEDIFLRKRDSSPRREDDFMGA